MSPPSSNASSLTLTETATAPVYIYMALFGLDTEGFAAARAKLKPWEDNLSAEAMKFGARGEKSLIDMLEEAVVQSDQTSMEQVIGKMNDKVHTFLALLDCAQNYACFRESLDGGETEGEVADLLSRRVRFNAVEHSDVVAKGCTDVPSLEVLGGRYDAIRPITLGGACSEHETLSDDTIGDSKQLTKLFWELTIGRGRFYDMADQEQTSFLCERNIASSGTNLWLSDTTIDIVRGVQLIGCMSKEERRDFFGRATRVIHEARDKSIAIASDGSQESTEIIHDQKATEQIKRASGWRVREAASRLFRTRSFELE